MSPLRCAGECEFVVPEHVQRLPLGVVIRTGEADKARPPRFHRLDDLVDEPTSRPHLHQLADAWLTFRDGSSNCL
jgi:hypothetical protein